MATVKKGNGTTKRRRTKAVGAGQQPSAEKSAAAAKRSNTKHASKTAEIDAATVEATPARPAFDEIAETRVDSATRPVTQATASKPAAEPATEPVPSEPAMKPVAESAPSAPRVEPTIAPVRNDFASAMRAPEAEVAKPAPARPDVEAIRVRAYHLFLARGGSHGDDLGDWLAAERQLINETRVN